MIHDSFVLIYIFTWKRQLGFVRHCFLQISVSSNIAGFFFKFCPHGHLRDHLPTSRGQSWTFDQPPTHLILSTWFLNAPLHHPEILISRAQPKISLFMFCLCKEVQNHGSKKLTLCRQQSEFKQAQTMLHTRAQCGI